MQDGAHSAYRLIPAIAGLLCASLEAAFTPTGWRPTEVAGEPVVYRRDGEALVVDVGLADRGRGWTSERFAVTPGAWFHFTGRIATSNLAHSTSFVLDYFNDKGKRIGSETVASQWAKNMPARRVHGVRQVPTEARTAELHAYLRGTGGARFDQISFDTSWADWQDETAENRLLNPGFEEADFDGVSPDCWVVTRGAARRTTDAAQGTYALELTPRAALDYGGTNACALAVAGGENLHAHVAFRGAGDLTLTLRFAPDTAVTRTFAATDDWSAADFEIAVPAGARTAALELATAAGAIAIDALYLGTRPFADAKPPATVPDLPLAPACEKMPRSCVRDFRGVPTWHIAEMPVVDSLYTCRVRPGQAAHALAYHARVIEAGRYPVYVIGDHINTDEVGPESLAEFLEEIDFQIRFILSHCPDARFLVWYQQYPTKTFALDYPNELARVEDTDQGFEHSVPGYSYGSEIWSKFCERSIRRFFEAIDRQDYAARIVGFMPGFGNYGENNYGHIAGKYYLSPHDFSPAMATFFRKWLLREYAGDVAAFDAAWGRTGFNFAHAQTPKMLQRAPRLEGGFLDARLQRQTIDYARCESFALLHRVDRQCRAAKLVTGGRVFTASELGYLYGVHYHREMAPILASPWLDAFAPAPGYTNRGAGDDIPAYAPVGSLKHHNKVYLFQADVRTHIESGRFATDSADESVAVLMREMGKYMTDGEIPYHWTFGKWYDDPKIYAFTREYERLMRLSARFPRQSAAEIAEVLDPLSLSAGIQYAYNGTPMATAGKYYDLNRRLEWHRLGAPRDLWLLDDLLASPKLDQYRLVILHGICALTAEQRHLVETRLRAHGRTLVWMYAPPVFRAEGTRLDYGLEHARAAGFSFAEEKGSHTLEIVTGGTTNGWSKTPCYCGLGTPGTRENPRPFPRMKFDARFVPQSAPDDGVEILGTYAEGGSPAAARRRTSAATDIFWGSVLLERDLLAAWAREAGVHLYTDRPAVVYANENFGCVHVKEAGPLAFRLKAKAEVAIDLVTRRVLAENADTLRLDLGAKSTALFYFGARADFDRAEQDVTNELARRDADLARQKPRFAFEAVRTNLAKPCPLNESHSVDGAGFIRDVLFLGPFASADYAGYGTDYLGGETTACPRAGEKVGNLAWLPRTLSTGRVRSISNEITLPFVNDLTYYLFTTVISPDDREAVLAVGSDDGEKTWVNGVLTTAEDARCRSCNADTELGKTRLRRGENTLLVKVTQGSGNNGHAVRFLDPRTGRPMTDLQTILK